MPIEIGSIAPTLDLPTDDNGMLSLTSLRSQKVVLYFYPKDMTLGCTTELDEFRDRSIEFEAANTIIVGASKDSVKQHDKFKAKYQLLFTLVSHEEGASREANDVWRKKKLYGKEYVGNVRSTYLIDYNGHIQTIWDKVKVKGRADAVLEAAQSL